MSDADADADADLSFANENLLIKKFYKSGIDP